MPARRFVLGLLAAIAGLLGHSVVSATGPEAVVQAQLEAYNARDLSAFLATYAGDVTRTFPEGTGTQDAIAMYEVQGTSITRVWFIFGAKSVDPKP